MNTDEQVAAGVAILTAMLDEHGNRGDLLISFVKSRLQDGESMLDLLLGTATVALSLAQWRESETGTPVRQTLTDVAVAWGQSGIQD